MSKTDALLTEQDNLIARLHCQLKWPEDKKRLTRIIAIEYQLAKEEFCPEEE